MILIKNGTLHTAVSKEPLQADILVDGGKIVKIGAGLSGEGAEVIDASGLNVYPGFVEAHCHIGLDGYGIGYEGHDYNELNDPVTPQLRSIDGINPFDPCMEMAAKAGVTCMATGPGSSNAHRRNLRGHEAPRKTRGQHDREIPRCNAMCLR